MIVDSIDQNLDRLMETFNQVQTLLSDYDKKLLRVLARHEHDFVSAYKTHMSKVERELHYLKNKAMDQETRLAQDERILKLQKQLEWFRDELERLNQRKEANY